MEKGPVFIAGLERSGTSLIYALLASHPKLAMSRRTNLWTYFYNQYGDLSRPQNFERCLAGMLRYKRLVLLKPDPSRIRREFWQDKPTYARLFALLEAHYAERAGKPRWGDKSLNTERYADQIFASYPNARIIHIIRDPRDRYASALTRWKVSRGGIGAGTAMWLFSMNLAKKNQKRYPNQYMILRYETLANHPEPTLRKVCAFIGEKYTPIMLSMQGAEEFRDEGGNSSYGQQHEPGQISTRSIGKFRNVLSQRKIAFMQLLARHEMFAYDYSLESNSLSIADWLQFTLLDIPVNVGRMFIWTVRETIQNWIGRTLPSYRIISEPNSMELMSHQ
jgi:hypothetical protein